MALLITSIILTVIAFLMLGFVKGFKKRRFAWGFNIVQPFALVFMLLLLIGSFASVPANGVGIIYSTVGKNRGIQNETLGEGIQGKSLFDNIIILSTSNKSQNVKVYGQTKDSIYAEFSLVVTYKIARENAGKFYRATNSVDLPETFLNSETKSSLQRTSSKYDVFTILGENLEVVRNEVELDLKNSLFEKYGVTVISVSIDDIDAGDKVEAFIQDKAKAMQAVEIAKQEEEKAKIEAAKLKIETDAKNARDLSIAEAQAQIVAIQADAEASKVQVEKEVIFALIKSYSEKYSGTLTEAQVTDLILRTMFYDKWDGILPTVIDEKGISLILDGLIQNP